MMNIDGSIPPNPKHILYIDILIILSAFGVVALHANGPTFWSIPSGRLWLTSNIFEAVFFFPVPIFFMIIGVTSVNYRERYSTSEYLIRRFKRVGFPFVFWTIIYFLYCHYFFGTFNYINLPIFLLGIFNHDYNGAFWFFVPLFAIYLSVPVLSYLANNNKLFISLAIYGFISVFILPFISAATGYHIDNLIQSPMCGNFVVYVMCGYIFNRYYTPKHIRIFIYILGLIGVIVQCAGTMYLTPPSGPINVLYKGCLTWTVFLQSLAVFIFIKYFKFPKIIFKHQLLIRNIAKNCFGVYLVHMFFIEFSNHYIDINSIWYRTVGAVIIFVACILLTDLFRKNKYLRLLIN